jgi:hypothetical protein
VRASKTLVRPGRRNGGTTLLFSLAQKALVRFTIVRVHPSCRRIGSFTVRGRRGTNRVRFNGRYRGRTLASGTYRLVVHARGQTEPAAVVTIVVARGQLSPAALNRARNANSCSSEEAREIEIAIGGTASGTNSTVDPTGSERSDGRSGILRVAGAVKGVTKKATFGREPVSDALMVILGLLTLASACLGAFVLVRLAKTEWPRLLR